MKFNFDSHKIFLAAAIVVSILILFPLTVMQPPISTGDNGRDFYAIQQTAQGAVPYQDYWWVYGPLMPYFYSLFYFLLGSTMKSILIGQFCLYLTSGVFFFLSAARLISPAFAFLGTAWFLTFEPPFTYTYNHVGAGTLMMVAVYFVLTFVEKRQARYILGAVLAGTVCAFIKLNMGLAVLAATGISCWGLEGQDKSAKAKVFFRVYLPSLLTAIVSIALIYGFLLKGLSSYQIRQCLPNLEQDRPVLIPFTQSLVSFLKATFQNTVTSSQSSLWGILILLSIGQTVFFLLQKNGDESRKKKLFSSLLCLAVFYIFIFHEFLLSGVPYRIIWVVPLQFLFIFIFVGTAFDKTARLIRGLLFAALLGMVFLRSEAVLGILRQTQNPVQFLPYANAQIYLTNTPEWIGTVRQTTDFLKANLKDDETFLVLPYDPLYYYLVQKKSPTWQLIFFEHMNIPASQELRIIDELKAHKTKYVLLSNRTDSPTAGTGTFGKTYCPLLAEYIDQHYQPKVIFGPWARRPGAIENHAIAIWQKRE